MNAERRKYRIPKIRLAVLATVAVLPSFLKRPIYRLIFGYKIGKRVKIGFSILDAKQCVIGDETRIGHLNLIVGVQKLQIGDHVHLGFLNIIRGGQEVEIGRYAEILRMNVVNSIPDPILVTAHDPTFSLGAGSVITSGHRIDFTDRVEIGCRTILGGRNSSLWTHNRQRTLPIRIGSLSYIGSEIRASPGAVIPSRCIVGIGAVIVGELKADGWLIAGVPAKPIEPLKEDAIAMIEYKTRPDLPDDI